MTNSIVSHNTKGMTASDAVVSLSLVAYSCAPELITGLNGDSVDDLYSDNYISRLATIRLPV